MRAFLAVEPSGEALGELQRAVGALHAPGLHPVRELHLTLRFFGDIPEAKAAEMKSALRDVPGFGARLEGAGAFPDWRRPRVIWAGVGPKESWDALHREVDLRLQDLGFRSEPFTPHITLARVKEGFIPESDVTLNGMLLKAAFPVRELLLKRSVLGPDGQVHTLLWTAPLTTEGHPARSR